MLKRISLIAFIAILLTACSGGDTVVGHWAVDQVIVNGETKSKDNVQKSLDFKEDGKFDSGEDGKKIERSGTWSYDEEKQTLTMKGDGGNKDDGDYKVEKLTADELVISKDELKVALKKLDTVLE